ncbi:hypothetical protein ACSBR1_034226 [Camellia fascicularis]
MSKTWLVARDFNDYGNQDEKISFFTSQNTTRTQKFMDKVDKCNLIDLGNTRPRMTCTNNMQGTANTMERLH